LRFVLGGLLLSFFFCYFIVLGKLPLRLKKEFAMRIDWLQKAGMTQKDRKKQTSATPGEIFHRDSSLTEERLQDAGEFMKIYVYNRCSDCF